MNGFIKFPEVYALLSTRRRRWLTFWWPYFLLFRSPEGTSQWPRAERRVTCPVWGFTVSPSLQDAHNSSAFIVGRHCGTLHEHLRKVVSTYQRYWDVNRTIYSAPDEISCPLRGVTIVSLWKQNIVTCDSWNISCKWVLFVNHRSERTVRSSVGWQDISVTSSLFRRKQTQRK